MSENKGELEITYENEINTKTGDFEGMSQENVIQFAKSVIYIIQDATVIKTKANDFGGIKFISLKASKSRYDVLLGDKTVKIVKYA
jgi:hypothetical protein